LYSPEYSRANATALRQDWQRIPLPVSKDQLTQSAQLGLQLADLLDLDFPVAHVTRGAIPSELASIAVVARVSGGSLNVDGGDLAVTAGWGRGGNGAPSCRAKG
jgi:hypothetical protein